MEKEILIEVLPQEKRVAIIEDNKLVEFYIERPERSIVGNIYKGKVEATTPSINACFIDIGEEKKGFLYLEEAPLFIEPAELHLPSVELKKGQEVLVQVTKEAFGTKGPRLSTHISLAGRYLVLMPFDLGIGVSRRIEDQGERERLRKILGGLGLPENVGFIIRTAAMGKGRRELLSDAKFLLRVWQKIKRTSYRSPAPSLIYEEYDLILRIVRDYFTEDVKRLICDSKGEFLRIRRFLKDISSERLIRRLQVYEDEIPLFEYRNIEALIEKIYSKRVDLESGAYLLIEPTEGLVVIDVNSGRFREKYLSPEELAFRVNLEAAERIPQELRLRNLGGIIVIDFIDMHEEKHRLEVLSKLKRGLMLDRAKTEVLGISKFGLIEMTRERVYKSTESISYEMCPYCQGKGKIKSASTIALDVLKELKKRLFGFTRDEIKIILHPKIAERLLNFEKESLLDLQRRFLVKIDIKTDSSFHLEHFRIY
jgi:ribonuclease G